MSQYSLRANSFEDQITIGMASIPERSDGMLRVIESLLPYCDNFDVYLNRYPIEFNDPILHDQKVTVYRGVDIGARGKLYATHRTPGYWLTVDDDLIYPPEYVGHIIAGIEKYARQAVVGYHGTLFARDPDPMQPNPRILMSHAAYVEHDLPVHMLGTGIFGYHSDTIVVDHRDMMPGKIDEQTAILCQDSRVPMMCLAHPDDWVTEDDDLKFKGALRRNVSASEEAKKRQDRPWHLFVPDSWKEYQKFP